MREVQEKCRTAIKNVARIHYIKIIKSKMKQKVGMNQDSTCNLMTQREKKCNNIFHELKLPRALYCLSEKKLKIKFIIRKRKR